MYHEYMYIYIMYMYHGYTCRHVAYDNISQKCLLLYVTRYICMTKYTYVTKYICVTNKCDKGDVTK